MKLSRPVPARTHTITAKWCKLDFMQMSQTFRRIRGKSRNPMDTCYWCKYAFEDGDMMALACFEKIGNKALCQTCGAELLNSAVNESEEAGG